MDMRAKACCFTGHRSLSVAEKLRQHRTIRQEVSARIFAPIQSSKNGGILYVPARGMPHP